MQVSAQAGRTGWERTEKGAAVISRPYRTVPDAEDEGSDEQSTGHGGEAWRPGYSRLLLVCQYPWTMASLDVPQCGARAMREHGHSTRVPMRRVDPAGSTPPIEIRSEIGVAPGRDRPDGLTYP